MSTLNKLFSNPLFSYMEDSVPLSFEDAGYSREWEAYNVVSRLGMDPALFLYIKFCDLWYAVSMKTFRHALVLSRTVLCYHTGGLAEPIRRIDIEDMSNEDLAERLPFKATALSSGKMPYAEPLLWDLEQVNGGELEYIYAPTMERAAARLEDLKKCCGLLLGSCLLTGHIPVFSLCAIEDWFTKNVPGEGMWKKGVTHVNPFQMQFIKGDKTPYYLNDWVAERSACGERISGQRPESVVDRTAESWRN